MATDKPVERNGDMDYLHYLVVEKMGKALHEAHRSSRVDNRQLVGDRIEAAQDCLTQIITQLDSIIPGGCPDDAALAASRAEVE